MHSYLINILINKIETMKFGEYLKQNILPEWADFYLNYRSLKTILGPFKKFYQSRIGIKIVEIVKKNKGDSGNKKTFNPNSAIELDYFSPETHKSPDSLINEETLLVSGISPEDEVILQRNFMDLIFLELNKFIHFFNENYRYYCNRFIKIRVLIIIN